MAKPPVPPTPAKIARTALRREYEDYLHRQRGLSDKTIASCWHRSEIADLQCLDDAQGNGSLRPHEADVASERVSRSDEFGYVFRYDVVTTENDDRGNEFRIHAILVIWSDDCKMLKLAS